MYHQVCLARKDAGEKDQRVELDAFTRPAIGEIEAKGIVAVGNTT